MKDRKLTSSEEACGGEIEEHVEPVDEDEDRDPEDAPVREPRLERIVIHELLPVKPLRLEPAVYTRARP